MKFIYNEINGKVGWIGLRDYYKERFWKRFKIRFWECIEYGIDNVLNKDLRILLKVKKSDKVNIKFEFE